MSVFLFGCADLETDIYFTFSQDLSSLEPVIHFDSRYDGEIAKSMIGFDILNLTPEQEVNVDAAIAGNWNTFSDEQKLIRFFETTLLESGVNDPDLVVNWIDGDYYISGKFSLFEDEFSLGDDYFVEILENQTVVTLIDFTSEGTYNEAFGLNFTTVRDNYIFPADYLVSSVESIVSYDMQMNSVEFEFDPNYPYGDSNVTINYIKVEDFLEEEVNELIIEDESDDVVTSLEDSDNDIDQIKSDLFDMAFESITILEFEADFDKEGYISKSKLTTQGAIPTLDFDDYLSDLDEDKIFEEMDIDLNLKSGDQILEEAYRIILDEFDLVDYTLNTNLQSDLFWFEFQVEFDNNSAFTSDDSLFNFDQDTITFQEDLEVDPDYFFANSDLSKIELSYNFPYPIKKVQSPLEFEISGNTVKVELLRDSLLAESDLIVEMQNTKAINDDSSSESSLIDWSYENFGSVIDLFPGDRKTKFYIFAFVVFVLMSRLFGRR